MDEEKFAAEIDPIFLDDLQVERERLEGLGKMCDMDIFTEYDEQACEGGLECILRRPAAAGAVSNGS